MSVADELLATMNRQHAALFEAIAFYPDDVLDRKNVVGPWSIKNVLAHLVTWQELVLNFLPARLETGAMPAILSAPQAERNGFLLTQMNEREGLTPHEQKAELEQTHRRLAAFIHTVDEDILTRNRPWPGWDGTVAAYLGEQVGGMEQAAIDRIRSGLSQLDH